MRDLNRCYAAEPALHLLDCESTGFHSIVGDDRDNSVFAFYRVGAAPSASPGNLDASHERRVAEDAPPVIAVCNFTPLPRSGYRLGAPRIGRWREILNSDAGAYGGSGIGNLGAVFAAAQAVHGQPFSLTLSLPPLATILLRHDGGFSRRWRPERL